MIICRHCQTEQPAGRFCTDCGQPLEQQVGQAISDQQPNQVPQQEQGQGNKQNDQQEIQQENLQANQPVKEEANDQAKQQVKEQVHQQEQQQEQKPVQEQIKAQENQQRELQTASAEPMNATESAGDQEADSFVTPKKPSKRAGVAWSGAATLRILVMPVVGFVVSLLISIGFGIWFQQSRWLKDWFYRLHTEYWGLSAAEASAAMDSFGATWWHVLVQMHAGKTQVVWKSAQNTVTELQYSMQLPLIGLVILGAIMMIIVQKLIGRLMRVRRAEQGFLSRINTIISSSLLYGILVMLTTLIFHPSEKWELPSALAGLSMAETTPAFSIWWRASFIYAVAALLATLSWRMRRKTADDLDGENGLSELTTMLTASMRLFVKWIALVTVIVVVIGLLIPIVWSVSDPLSFYEQPPSSIVHQWRAYSDDPMFWGALPTFWVQEWLFATGGQLRLEGSMLADLLRLEPMRLHLVTGVTVDEEMYGEPSSALLGLATAARTNWHVWSMLVLTLYGTARLARRSGWLELTLLAVGAGGFAAAAAYLTSLGFGVQHITEVQRLGHSPAYAAVQLAVISFVAGAAGKLWSSQIDRLRRMNGVGTDGDK